MFFLLGFLSDTLDVLEEFLNLIRRKKEEDYSISKKKKPPTLPDFMNMGM